MSANTYLRVTELDFNEIRNNLKTYLSTQDQFKDYDFEGSAMSVLLDLLAYNTHYNAYYVNVLANEMFLDTAQQRDSVVSFAKALGYTPTSAIGPHARVRLTFNGVSNTVSQFSISRNSKFTTTVDDVTYTFVTPESTTVLNTANTFIKTIEIKEGTPVTHRFNVSTSNPIRYILPNQNVDTSSLVVNVQNSSVDTTTTEFIRATNIRQIFTTSPVYFLEEASDGKYEIIFGQGALGKSLQNGNIVIVDYLVNNADAANGANTFSVDSLTASVAYTSVDIDVITRASGGRPQETIESVKFNAPKSYQTQNRAVIAEDYQRIILSENSDIQSVVAFGGENATPQLYGKVLIAAKPFGEQFITATRKQQLRESILERTPLAVDPLFIDAKYTYIVPTVITYYDKNKTVASPGQIETAIRQAITNFSTNSLERFGNRLRFSQFVRFLDNTNVGEILNNDVSFILESRITPNTQRAERLLVEFNNQIRSGTVTSSQFTFAGFLSFIDDDSNGNIRIYRFNDVRQKIYINSQVGTVDYTTGVINIEGFAPTAYAGIEMKINAQPLRLDIVPVREQILIMNQNDAIVTVIGESV